MKSYFMNFNKATKLEIPTISFTAECNAEARAKVQATAQFYHRVHEITLTGISLYVGGIGTGWYPVNLEPESTEEIRAEQVAIADLDSIPPYGLSDTQPDMRAELAKVARVAVCACKHKGEQT